MTDAPVGLALAAGMLAAVNPCGFALLPAYLGLLVRGEDDPPGAGPAAGEGGVAAAGRTVVTARVPAMGRAVAAAAAMPAGFVVVFGTFGLLTASAAGLVQRHLPWFTVLFGVAVTGVGGWMLAGRAVAVPWPRPALAPRLRRNAASMGLFGAAYAVVSLGCTIGPFLAIVVVTFRSSSTTNGLLVFLAYAGGMGLAVTAAALAVALSGGPALAGLRRWRPLVNRAGGGLLAVTGAYVAYYGWFELRVYSGDAATDPVVDGAERVQRWLAGGLAQLGVARLALVVGLLAAVPLVVGRLRRRWRGRDLTRPAAPPPRSAAWTSRWRCAGRRREPYRTE